MKRLSVASAICLIAALGLVVWLLPERTNSVRAADAADGPAHYIFETIEQGKIERYVVASGTLSARVTVQVGSQLSGQVVRTFADFNDRVAKGEKLAQLDQKGLQARLAQARAALQIAEANTRIQQARLERARVDMQIAESQRPVLQARIDIARANLDAAEANYRRKQALSLTRAAPLAEVDDAAARRDATAAALREAEAIAAALENTVAAASVDYRRTEAELQSALSDVPQKQAAVSLAEIDLERSTIRSPVDGLVIARTVSEGQTVAVSLEAPTLFTIAGDLSEMEIHARVDEMDIGSIAAGQKATFTVDARPDTEFSATVRQVRKAPEVLQNVVTYTVVLVTDNTEDLLLPGLTATVRISTLATDPTLKVPLAALSFAPGGDQPADSAAADPSGRRIGRIWIAEAEGPLRPVTVELGEEDSSHVAVKSGTVHAGDQVVVGQTVEAAPRQLFGIRIGF